MPTLINSYLVTSTTAGQTLTTPSFTPSTGEIIVVKSLTEDESATADNVSATGGGITFTLRATVNSNNFCYAKLWTGPVTSGGSAITVSVTFGTGGAGHSMLVERWDGNDSALDATPVVVQTTIASGQTTTITTEAAGSAISWALGDWTATSPGTPTYSSAGGTPTQEGIHNATPTNYAGYYVRQTTTAGAGSKTFGITSPTGLKSSIVAIEILSAGGGGTNYDKTPADSEGLTDSAADVVDAQRAPSDAEGLTDSATDALDAVREPADSEGLTDSATDVLDAARAPADSAGLTDSATDVVDAQ